MSNGKKPGKNIGMKKKKKMLCKFKPQKLLNKKILEVCLNNDYIIIQF